LRLLYIHLFLAILDKQLFFLTKSKNSIKKKTRKTGQNGIRRFKICFSY